jgi:hypothetical protein
MPATSATGVASAAPQVVASTTDSGANLDPQRCGGVAYVAKAKELEILVLFDNSLSMLLPALSEECWSTLEGCLSGPSLTLWDVAVSELTSFVKDPKSAGVSVALKYFGTECDPASYATPDVPLGSLPENGNAIEQSLAATLPLAETATRPALQGALAYVRSRAKLTGQSARQIVLLVTDGYPDEADCSDNTTQAVSQVAASGLADDPAIATYVFVTAPELALDPIAKAGGTEKALAADLTRVGALSAALNGVRDRELAALPCEYELPPEYFKELNDPSRVNLTRDGKPIGRIGSAADCRDDTDAWYYDNPAAPTRILTCEKACANLKRAAAVDVQLKCPTVELL